jgi:hypothetical protein
MKGVAMNRAFVLVVVAAACMWAACGGATAAASSAAVPTTTAASQPSAGGEVVEGTMTCTSLGGGTWRAYFNAAGAKVVGADNKSVWFARGATLWRYSLAKRQVDVCTSPITLPEINGLALSPCLSSDGRLAVGCRAAMLLWSDGKWTRLPQPGGSQNAHEVSFDAKGDLWATSLLKESFRWDGKRWDKPVKVAGAPEWGKPRPSLGVAADDKALPALPPLPPGIVSFKEDRFFRDANGDYWFHAWRCDGKKWQCVLPPGAFVYYGDYGATRQAIADGRLRLDGRGETWLDARPEIPTDVFMYDPAKRTGWLRKKPVEWTRPTWEQFQFAADGGRTLLRTITIPDTQWCWPAPQFEDLAGNLWFTGFHRFDGKATHYYDSGFRGARSDKLAMPQVILGPTGTVWMYHTDRSWRRYDPAKDAFAEGGEPFDDFKFDAGGRTFSIVPNPTDPSWDWASHLGMVHVRQGGAWQGLSNPFVGNALVTRGSYGGRNLRFAGWPGRCVCKGRMLVTCFFGTFEWDIEKDLWAYLSPQSLMSACYDEQGRRMLVCPEPAVRILTYEGEPFARAGAPPSGEDLDKTVHMLLKEMDSERWKDRERATQEAINLVRKSPEVGKMLGKWALTGTWSPEVQARVAIVMKECPRSGSGERPLSELSHEEAQLAVARLIGNSLLERMYPPMAPACDYTVKPGMDYGNAWSVFTAAGARYSAAIHNAHYPDLSYQGFLLSNNTMVYIRIRNKDRSGDIVSMGLGEAGKGFDKNWPWDDPAKNGLRSLELKPYRATIQD